MALPFSPNVLVFYGFCITYVVLFTVSVTRLQRVCAYRLGFGVTGTFITLIIVTTFLRAFAFGVICFLCGTPSKEYTNTVGLFSTQRTGERLVDEWLLRKTGSDAFRSLRGFREVHHTTSTPTPYPSSSSSSLFSNPFYQLPSSVVISLWSPSYSWVDLLSLTNPLADSNFTSSSIFFLLYGFPSSLMDLTFLALLLQLCTVYIELKQDRFLLHMLGSQADPHHLGNNEQTATTHTTPAQQPSSQQAISGRSVLYTYGSTTPSQTLSTSTPLLSAAPSADPLVTAPTPAGPTGAEPPGGHLQSSSKYPSQQPSALVTGQTATCNSLADVSDTMGTLGHQGDRHDDLVMEPVGDTVDEYDEESVSDISSSPGEGGGRESQRGIFSNGVRGLWEYMKSSSGLFYGEDRSLERQLLHEEDKEVAVNGNEGAAAVLGRDTAGEGNGDGELVREAEVDVGGEVEEGREMVYESGEGAIEGMGGDRAVPVEVVLSMERSRGWLILAFAGVSFAYGGCMAGVYCFYWTGVISDTVVTAIQSSFTFLFVALSILLSISLPCFYTPTPSHPTSPPLTLVAPTPLPSLPSASRCRRVLWTVGLWTAARFTYAMTSVTALFPTHGPTPQESAYNAVGIFLIVITLFAFSEIVPLSVALDWNFIGMMAGLDDVVMHPDTARFLRLQGGYAAAVAHSNLLHHIGRPGQPSPLPDRHRVPTKSDTYSVYPDGAIDASKLELSSLAVGSPRLQGLGKLAVGTFPERTVGRAPIFGSGMLAVSLDESRMLIRNIAGRKFSNFILEEVFTDVHILQSIEHPNLLPIAAAAVVSVPTNSLWLCYPFVPSAISYFQLMHGSHRTIDGGRSRVSLELTLRLLHGILDCLISLHKIGLSHGHLTSHNILLQTKHVPYPRAATEYPNINASSAASPAPDGRFQRLWTAGRRAVTRGGSGGVKRGEIDNSSEMREGGNGRGTERRDTTGGQGDGETGSRVSEGEWEYGAVLMDVGFHSLKR
eukprot:GHVQ01008712.1.p1 GENE.GHVQ01008712.1~~GHVQ01008712.1.p1  ORF type:complete len:998 (-),score=146.56 GHVQ01008712.1:907-3900(-)